MTYESQATRPMCILGDELNIKRGFCIPRYVLSDHGGLTLGFVDFDLVCSCLPSNARVGENWAEIGQMG